MSDWEWADVFRLLDEGKTQRQIAEELQTSRKSVWRVIESVREIDEIMRDVVNWHRNWGRYEQRGQIRPRGAWDHKMKHGDKEWYQENKKVTTKEAQRVLNRKVEAIANPDGTLEYWLSSSGTRIGKLDPRRLWVKKLIQSQEMANGGWIADRRAPEDNDRSGDDRQPAECAEGGTPEGESL